MPKLPINYDNCCIYKIEHIDNERLLYVGQTTILAGGKENISGVVMIKNIPSII